MQMKKIVFENELRKFKSKIKKKIRTISQKYLYEINYVGFGPKKEGIGVAFYNKKKNKKPENKNLYYHPNDLLISINIAIESSIIKVSLIKNVYFSGMSDNEFIELREFKNTEVAESFDYFEKELVKLNSKLKIKDFYTENIPDNFEP